MGEVLLLTAEEAARRLGIGRTQLYALLARGEIPSISFGKSRRISPADLEAFIARKREEALEQEQAGAA